MVKMRRTNSPVFVTIAADTTDYNLFTAMGSPTTRTNVVVTINPGVKVTATSTGTAAFRTGGPWPSGSKIRLINNGIIAGAGGVGGCGGDGSGSPNHGSNGLPGGPALDLAWPVTIDNTNGLILGGGGGAGGGADFWLGGSVAAGGGGGGAGIGYNNAAGGAKSNFNPASNPADGEAASSSTGGGGGDRGSDPFTGHQAGNGGSNRNQTFANGVHNLYVQGWGDVGGNGYDAADGVHVGGSGAAGGPAVKSNGNAVTWDGGHDATHVKGTEI